MFPAEVQCTFDVGLYRVNDFYSLMAERGLDEVAAPAAHADDSCANHSIPSVRLGRCRIASITAASCGEKTLDKKRQAKRPDRTIIGLPIVTTTRFVDFTRRVL